ncbi:hypothetical protein NGM37_25895, partial [Streptomyces sp. TRM76130]|nr:hypothetical protein [Streptomyces sp. TRM76130]
MGALRATLCAGTALLAALAPATAHAAHAAHAADAGNAGDGRVAVVPAHPAPGTDVTLRVHGCAARSAVAVSAAFESAARLSLTSSDGALVGAGRVRASAEAGDYPVRVRCGPERHEGRLVVAVAGSPRPTPRDARPEDRATAHASP